MRKASLLLLLAVAGYALLFSQDSLTVNRKIYLARIDLFSSARNFRGVVYRTSDSALVFTPVVTRPELEAGRFMTTEIGSQDIYRIRFRNKNSIRNGFIIGSAVGLVSYIAFIPEGGTGMGTVFDALFIGAPITFMYGAAGGLIGSLGMKIPIGGSQERYLKNIDRINSHSFLTTGSTVRVNHRSMIGLTDGPSFPLGSFKSEGFALTGYRSNVINVYYNFSENFGINVKGFNGQWEIKEGGEGTYWIFAGVDGGPVYSLSLGNRFILDLMVQAGGVGAGLELTDNQQESWSGFCGGAGAAVRFNFARRWCLIGESSIVHYSIRNNIGEKNGFPSLNLGIGAGYRFN